MNMKTGIRTPVCVLALALLGAAAIIGPVAAQQDDAPVAPDGTPTYTVKDGQVDKGTYNGYRRFHSVCHTCHGFDANGSSFAPALVDSLKRLSYDQFKEVVINGRQNQGATGDKVMPSFGTDPNVVQNLDDIYRYLKARADGALPGGRPQRIGS
ncbi:c-type cytochrome [Azospirillum sp. sgz301742]